MQLQHACCTKHQGQLESQNAYIKEDSNTQLVPLNVSLVIHKINNIMESHLIVFTIERANCYIVQNENAWFASQD